MHALIGAIHVHPAVTVPIGVIVLAWMAWYWLRLGRKGVPASRRIIRRCSLAAMLIGLPALVAAASYFDPDGGDAQAYVMSWLIAMLVLLIVVVLAIVDGLNSMYVHSLIKREEAIRAADELVAAMEQRANELERRAAREDHEA